MNNNRRIEKEDYVLAIILILITAEHIASYFILGRDFFDSFPLKDSNGYWTAGLRFAETGVISIYSDYPSAMIMPGMPVLIGMLCKLLGGGTFLKYTGVRIVWYSMGIAAAYFTAKAAEALSTKRAGIIAATVFMLPNHVLSDNFLLTETPFMLFVSMMLYFLFTMKKRRGAFTGFVISFFCAYMFRAEALIILTFSLLYMAWNMGKKEFLKKICCVTICFFVFTVPWTIRNYKCFQAFIPVTYGGGNPKLLGTQQGEEYPPMDDPEIQESAERILLEQFGRYYDENGKIIDEGHAQYLSQKRDGIMAKIILRRWIQENRWSFLKSYLIHKPRLLLNWVWYWEDLFGVSYDLMHWMSIGNMLFCVYSTVISGLMKKKHGVILFLLGSYAVNVYVHAFSFATDRYSFVMMLNRILAAAIGAELTIQTIERRIFKITHRMPIA